MLVHLPPEATSLAAQHDYRPLNVSLLKTVVAVVPQQVCQVRTDGVVATRRLTWDRQSRAAVLADLSAHGWR